MQSIPSIYVHVMFFLLILSQQAREIWAYRRVALRMRSPLSLMAASSGEKEQVQTNQILFQSNCMTGYLSVAALCG